MPWIVSRMLLVLGAFFLFVPVGSAFAQSSGSEASQTQPSNNWAVNCAATQTGGSELVCQMVQNVIVSETRQRLMSVIIRPQPENETPLMTLSLPHGLDFVKGVEMQIDEKDTFTIPVRTSNQQGAFATHQIGEEFLTDLRAGTTITFAFFSLSGQTFRLPISLVGFSAAFEKLVAN